MLTLRNVFTPSCAVREHTKWKRCNIQIAAGARRVLCIIPLNLRTKRHITHNIRRRDKK